MNLKTIHFSKSFFLDQIRVLPPHRPIKNPHECGRVCRHQLKQTTADLSKLDRILISTSGFGSHHRMAATLKAGAGLLREAAITGCRCDQTQVLQCGSSSDSSYPSYLTTAISTGFGILHPFFVPSSPVAPTFRFQLSRCSQLTKPRTFSVGRPSALAVGFLNCGSRTLSLAQWKASPV